MKRSQKLDSGTHSNALAIKFGSKGPKNPGKHDGTTWRGARGGPTFTSTRCAAGKRGESRGDLQKSKIGQIGQFVSGTNWLQGTNWISNPGGGLPRSFGGAKKVCRMASKIRRISAEEGRISARPAVLTRVPLREPFGNWKIVAFGPRGRKTGPFGGPEREQKCVLCSQL